MDTRWFDPFFHERESALATLEILADRELAGRLLKLAQTLDRDVKAEHLHSISEVFGE